MAHPSKSLLMAIQYLHAAIADEQDPKDVQTLSQCLAKMTQVQSGIMAPAGAGAGGYGGGNNGGGSPPSGPSTPADPRLFLGG